MWRAGFNRTDKTVVCIACGDSVSRSEAREYDKEGNRWERHDKQFEHVCKPCFRGLCHQPRVGLEPMLVEIEADGLSQEEFLRRYVERVESPNAVDETDS